MNNDLVEYRTRFILSFGLNLLFSFLKLKFDLLLDIGLIRWIKFWARSIKERVFPSAAPSLRKDELSVTRNDEENDK